MASLMASRDAAETVSGAVWKQERGIRGGAELPRPTADLMVSVTVMMRQLEGVAELEVPLELCV